MFLPFLDAKVERKTILDLQLKEREAEILDA